MNIPPSITLPDRPLAVRPPGVGVGSSMKAILFALLAAGAAKTGPGRWTGAMTDGTLPPRARDELVEKGVVLAPVVHVLEAVIASPDPLYWPR